MKRDKLERLDEARSRLSEEQRASENADHYEELDEEQRKFAIPPSALEAHEEGDGPTLAEIMAGESTVDDEDAEATSTPGEDGEDNQEEQES